MLYGLINVTWFDLITVGTTITVLIAVQILNALWALEENKNGTDCTDKAAISAEKINESKISFTDAGVTSPNIDKISVTPSATTNTTTTSSPTKSATTNGKLQKQQSEQCEKYVSNFRKKVFSKRKKYLNK